MTILSSISSQGGGEEGADGAGLNKSTKKKDLPQTLGKMSINAPDTNMFLAEIEMKNKYKDSINAKYGDMPKVFAFEVENNIRQILIEILKPVV